MKKYAKILCTFLALLIIFSASASAFAVTYKTENVKRLLGERTLLDEYDMWHYSDGTWKVGNAFSSFTWTDAEIGGAMNIGRRLQSKTTVTFQWKIPDEWRAQATDGLVLHTIITPVSRSWGEWYNTSSFKQTYVNGLLTYTFSPYYHISSLRTMDDYVSGLRISMPLVDVEWGNNLYSIFRGSSNLGRSAGRYWDSYPNGIGVGYMHPSFISNKTGALKSGYTISTEAGNVATAGLSVGTNTLVNGGALGLLFKFPLYAQVYLEGTVKVPVYTAEELAEQERRAEEEERQRQEEERRRQEEEQRRREELLRSLRVHRVQ